MIEIYRDSGFATILYVCFNDKLYYRFEPIRGWVRGENPSGVACIRSSEAKRITAKEAAEILGYIPRDSA